MRSLVVYRNKLRSIGKIGSEKRKSNARETKSGVESSKEYVMIYGVESSREIE